MVSDSILVIDDFLRGDEADLIADVITVNTVNCSDIDYVNGVLPSTLGEAFAAKLGEEEWDASGDVRFTCRWSNAVEPHRDWMKPGHLWVLLVYLNDVAEGSGRTVFYDDNRDSADNAVIVRRVSPVKGRAVLFDGYTLHSAEEPMSKKLILACDLLKART